jgi:hypothetical protein
MSVANDGRSPGQDWRQIVGRKSLDDFAAAFTEDAVLDASVLNGPVKGPNGIRTYLEWEGTALGGRAVAGATVLTRNATGKIESVRLMHRPLAMVLDFAAELARRLDGTLDPM